MRCIQQIHTKIISIFEHLFAILLAKVGRHDRKHIESAIRLCNLNTRYGFQQFQHPLSSSCKLNVHFQTWLEVTRKCHNRATLCYRISTTCILTLKLFTSFNHIWVSSDITKSIPCHGIPLTQSINDDNSVFQFLKLSNAFMLAYKIDVFINFIRYNKDIWVFFEYFC